MLTAPLASNRVENLPSLPFGGLMECPLWVSCGRYRRVAGREASELLLGTTPAKRVITPEYDDRAYNGDEHAVEVETCNACCA
jgi:hypothetical protein